ncbi:Stk1 family PASTA domain-containing Ser/Thr kinase [Anaerosalibacter sp. Marseille-P3206]|uniref:Stk1 family PASTA domain-containing Ser/Thr kinase n=1 Tax=Anaerosalibacter sp. Marseille-P3206 TaxID=1871005 RepID=UPI0009862678|nr:Stk1 family PASTA domain-containing Ser/Thr kinase [Anaerosalibacter sp. Marseille-P3206]
MIGKILGGRYEILEKIGGGGMALVYKARCQLLNRYVAIKVLRDEFTNDEEFIKKFRHESQAAASLSHPNIVSIYDVGSEGNTYYIVMEYIKGKTLKEIIKEKGKLTPEETINYSIQIAEALQHAHNNHIVHRDIKPHNIMVTEDKRVKVTDFGIARAATSTTMTNTSNVIGSVHYFSPEQARGRFTDEKSDIYSLGIVMYEMITGKVPFEGESPISIALKHVEEEIIPPRTIDASVPENIEYIIMKCVKKNQIERYKNAGELLRDLRKIKYSNGEIDFIEDTNELDSATRIIPVVGGEGETNDMETKRKVKQKKKNSNDSSKKAVFWGILLSFLVATGLFIGSFKFKGLFGSSEVEVPKLIGLQEEVAKEEIESLGLKFAVREKVNNSEFQEGQVVAQSVEPGTKVKKNYPIEVDVSLGSKLAKVPKLENRDITEVDELLDKTGLSEGEVRYEYSDTIPINIVISQDPDPYMEVPEGSKVSLIVSKGPETKTVIMPKITGLKENEAKRALIANQLKVGEVLPEYSDDVPKGEVIWQSIESGNEIEINTAIDISVSKGPEKKNEGNNGTGNEEVVRSIKITLPQDRNQTEVKIYRTQDGVSELKYNSVHDVSEGSIVVNLEGKPNAKFDIYFDDVYQVTLPD